MKQKKKKFIAKKNRRHKLGLRAEKGAGLSPAWTCKLSQGNWDRLAHSLDSGPLSVYDLIDESDGWRQPTSSRKLGLRLRIRNS